MCQNIFVWLLQWKLFFNKTFILKLFCRYNLVVDDKVLVSFNGKSAFMKADKYKTNINDHDQKDTHLKVFDLRSWQTYQWINVIVGIRSELYGLRTRRLYLKSVIFDYIIMFIHLIQSASLCLANHVRIITNGGMSIKHSAQFDLRVAVNLAVYWNEAIPRLTLVKAETECEIKISRFEMC